jgi:hypothetical protein
MNQLNDDKQRLIAAGIALGVFLVGTVFLSVLGARAIAATRATNWPVASGTIVESLDIKTGQVGRGRHAKRRITFDVAYKYSVDGGEYSGNVFSFHPDTFLFDFRKPHFNALAERFKAGSAVPVFYNPSSPRDSVLRAEVPLNLLVSIVFIATVVVAALLTFVYKRMWRAFSIKTLTGIGGN